jgi:hypothetical protein
LEKATFLVAFFCFLKAAELRIGQNGKKRPPPSCGGQAEGGRYKGWATLPSSGQALKVAATVELTGVAG